MEVLREYFALNDDFIAKFRGLQPKWGPLGLVIYLRTYARIKEDGTQEQFYETLQRVVEGVYAAQKAHCKQLHLPWSDSKAQRSAQEMFTRMWQFKFLPPGRGLEHLGAPSLYKVGGMCLYNCGFVTTENLERNFSGPFTTAADALMLGVGIGFDVRGAGSVTLSLPTLVPETYAVPDSREGWCEAMKILLDAYAGKRGLPKFDYTQIRPLGTPIKSFGGLAPGPQPLIDLHTGVHTLLSAQLNKPISSVTITDLFNLIGKCVVSGGKRRTSELALGSPEDIDFFDMKNPDRYGEELRTHRWASNNSVSAHVGMDYSPFVENICKNGEPGFIWLDNCRKYSRIDGVPDFKDTGVMGTNPCIRYDAPILTPDGICRAEDIEVGNSIWSGTKWTKVLQKINSGVKPTFAFRTRAGTFLGTENHKILCKGIKTEVRAAESIDIAKGPQVPINRPLDPQDIMDGLVLGDGGRSNNSVMLYIGYKDQDYFESEVRDLIHEEYASSRGGYKVTTTLRVSDLPSMHLRTVPDRYMYGTIDRVRGFLRGLFSANGAVTRNRVVLAATSFDIIEKVQILLSAVGIRSNYSKLKGRSCHFKNGIYTSRPSFHLYVTQDRAAFADEIGFIQGYKTLRLQEDIKRIAEPTKNKNTYKIEQVTTLGDAQVYDFTVDDSAHTYWTGGLLVSNCGEIPLESNILQDGSVEMELCNLSEVYPANHETYEDFQRTLKFAYLYNKSVTLIPTHNPHVNTVIMRNRRIGTALGGVVQALQKHGKREILNWCDAGYAYIQKADQVYSDWLGIPRSIKTTTLKPSGSISLLSGATPGIHFPHAEYYIRRVRFEATSPLLPALAAAGYTIEPDYYAPNTSVVEFPIKEPLFTKAKADVSLWEQLELAAQLQAHWADNSVSVTVTLKPSEFKDLKSALEFYETRLKSVSFLPITNDSYEQMPYETITADEYTRRTEILLPISLENPNTATKDRTERFCEGEYCVI